MYDCWGVMPYGIYEVLVPGIFGTPEYVASTSACVYQKYRSLVSIPVPTVFGAGTSIRYWYYHEAINSARGYVWTTVPCTPKYTPVSGICGLYDAIPGTCTRVALSFVCFAHGA